MICREPVRNEPCASVVITCIRVVYMCSAASPRCFREGFARTHKSTLTGSVRCTRVHRKDPCVTPACILRTLKHPYIRAWPVWVPYNLSSMGPIGTNRPVGTRTIHARARTIVYVPCTGKKHRTERMSPCLKDVHALSSATG